MNSIVIKPINVSEVEDDEKFYHGVKFSKEVFEDFFNRCPLELKYDGDELDVEIDPLEGGGDPIPDGRTGGDDIHYSDSWTATAHLTHWTYDLSDVEPEDLLQAVCQAFKKERFDITDADLISITAEDCEEGGSFYEDLKDYFRSDAESDAQNNYTEDDIEIDEDCETDED